MEQQLEQGVLEIVPEILTGEDIQYIPHQAVIRDQAESTKVRIVYDCSAKANSQEPSLNDCLEVGPPLHSYPKPLEAAAYHWRHPKGLSSN